MERDGNKGWVKGPALWLDNQRLVVGSEKGKLRRPDSDVEAKLPIVYAADYTEVPVHPDRKLSKGSSKHGKTNPTAQPHQQAEAAAETAAPGGATQAAIITDKTVEQPTSESLAPPPVTQPASAEPAKEVNVEGKNVRAAADGSAVHLPDHQPAHPAVTAEYLSSNSNVSVAPAETPSKQEPAPTTATTTPAVAAVAASPPTTTTTTSQPPSEPASQTQSHAHPPALPQSGPLPEHVKKMNEAVAQALSQESVSEIPATANGHAAHPEVLVASDASKGLAIESEKLGRPPIERFITAAEVKS